eukprot:Skav201608  [mRNA]  locus=scaffold152:1000783:1006238:+ [translate_table: standard]
MILAESLQVAGEQRHPMGTFDLQLVKMIGNDLELGSCLSHEPILSGAFFAYMLVQTGAAAFQQERPDGGWQHKGGKKVSDITVGSLVSGTVTNSSNTFGVYVDFGCEKDGKLSVPTTDWKKYRVGDRVERMVVNKVNVDRKFVDLLVVGSKGQSIGLEASKQVSGNATQPLGLRRGQTSLALDLFEL